MALALVVQPGFFAGVWCTKRWGLLSGTCGDPCAVTVDELCTPYALSIRVASAANVLYLHRNLLNYQHFKSGLCIYVICDALWGIWQICHKQYKYGKTVRYGEISTDMAENSKKYGIYFQ